MGDDVLSVEMMDDDSLQVTFNNIGFNTGPIPSLMLGDTFLMGLETNGLGLMSVYIGNTTTAMFVLGAYAVGEAAASVENWVVGNNSSHGEFSFNGHYAAPVHYNRQIGLDGFEQIRVATLPTL
jgi:hypothetical protein